MFADRVQVTFHDRRVWARCVENHDVDSNPQNFVGYNPFQQGTGWRDRYLAYGVLSSLDSKEEVAKYLGHQIHYNGYNLSELDSWKDLPDDAVTVTDLSYAVATES